MAGKLPNEPKATEETFAPDAPTHAQVMTLLDLLQVRKMMATMMDGMKQAMKQGAEETFRERVPDPTPKQLEALHGMIDDAIGDLPLDEIGGSDGANLPAASLEIRRGRDDPVLWRAGGTKALA